MILENRSSPLLPIVRPGKDLTILPDNGKINVSYICSIKCQATINMRRFLTLFLLCYHFLSVPLGAQLNLTGSLTDAVTKEPVGFATVYLDGTSIGDVSADDGFFRINIPAGRENSVMIVSHLNYRTIAVTLTPQARNLELVLRPKAAVLTSIEVADDDLRVKNLQEFRHRLIGNDAWGRNVTILNDEVIRFDRDSRRVTIRVANEEMAKRLRNRSFRNPAWSEDGKKLSYDRPLNLKAATNAALRLSMPHLGYELYLDLQSYESNYGNNRMSFLGTTYFIPDTSASRSAQRRFRRNRRAAYYGSGLHFIRSLLRDSLRENGFQVVEVVKEPAPGKAAETKPINLNRYVVDRGDGTYRLQGLESRNIAVLYHGNRNAPGRTPDLRDSPRVLQSRMVLIGPQALLYRNGAQGDTNLLFSGDIGGRAMAWALPLDYWPDK